ncbi:hypothetical protein [Streptomyces europaeiscabiei]|nr:hypothetical protein [Streptomyces europaeiscabiei]MDX3612391.1 hypothetical protein [Streptomyces europaeiscabiei]
MDHTHRLLAAILRRHRAVTMTFLARLLGVNRFSGLVVWWNSRWL